MSGTGKASEPEPTIFERIVEAQALYMSDEEANKLKYGLATSLNLKHFLRLCNE